MIAYFVFYRKPFKVLTYGFASDIGGLKLSRASGGAYTQRIRYSLAEGGSEDRGIAGQLARAAEKRRTQGQLVSSPASPTPFASDKHCFACISRVLSLYEHGAFTDVAMVTYHDSQKRFVGK